MQDESVTSLCFSALEALRRKRRRDDDISLPKSMDATRQFADS